MVNQKGERLEPGGELASAETEEISKIVNENESDGLISAETEEAAQKRKALKRKKRLRACKCGKFKRDSLAYCLGPNCPYEWVHFSCAGIKVVPVPFFCCDKCRDEDLAAAKHNEEIEKQERALEIGGLVDYEYCICKKQLGGEMVGCDRMHCDIGWYHCECVGLTKIPKGKWVCPNCKAFSEARKKATQEAFEVLKEAEIDLTGVPFPKITAEDVADARRMENELRMRRKEARINGVELVRTCEHLLKLARSTIHGRGMFAIKRICKNACLIEYVGTLINQTEVDGIEKQYKEEGITSIYFFTASSDLVIDATKFGNNARYINHSCRPNVYSQHRDVDGQKKIFFHAKRDIEAGEELTIDYNFEYDPLQPRIRCQCRRPGCRKFLDL
jgi:hypothetical protein